MGLKWRVDSVKKQINWVQSATDSLVATKKMPLKKENRDRKPFSQTSVPVFVEVAILRCFPTPWLLPPRPARAPLVSDCSRCRPSPGGPSRGRAPGAAPESSRRTRPGRRRDSGGWRDAGRTPAGTRCRRWCPDLGPSKPGGPRPSPDLDTEDGRSWSVVWRPKLGT